MKKYLLKSVTATALTAIALTAQTAYSPPPDPLQQRVQQMAQAMVRNEQQLHTYQWLEYTTLTLDGRPTSPKQSICRYVADGTVLKTPRGQQGAQSGQKMPRDPIGKHIVEQKMKKVQDDVKQIHALTQLYLPFNQAKFKEVFRTGKVDFEHDATHGDAIIINNYVKPGDQLKLTLAMTMQIDRISVMTYFDEPKDRMTVDMSFAVMPDGTMYPALTSIEAPSKKLSIVTANSDFSKLVGLSIVRATASSQVASEHQAPASAPAASSGIPNANAPELQASALAAGSGIPIATAPKNASELQALAAPIALYPDQLVAMILGAATFPDQVAVADYWLQQNKNLTGTALSKAIGEQTWDASVNAVTQFPSVLHNMAQNLVWTSSLGEAYHNQQADVMAAIQILRAEAKTAGNLKSTSQITVQETSPRTIVIEPANPEIVYVPEYNPTVVYGTTYVTEGYSTSDIVETNLLSFGAGVAVGAAVSEGWGWSSWGCNWYGGVVVYEHNTYYGNGGWHGGYYNGYRNGYDKGYNKGSNNGSSNSGSHDHGGSSNGGSNSGSHDHGGSGNGGNGNTSNRAAARNEVNHPSAPNTEAQRESNAGKSGAFGGLGGHSGGFGNGGGWASRAESNRGWGSIGSGGFHGPPGGLPHFGPR